MSNDLKQRSADWHEARRGLVTASNVGAILGCDPNRGPEDVLRAMVRDYHGAEREFTGNIATDYGNMHEEGARHEFEMFTGRQVTETGFHVHPDLDWLGASPDGFVGTGNELIEIKCPFGLRDKEEPQFKTLDDQPHYYAQIQVQLICTVAKGCHFWQWSPHGNRLDYVEPDDEWVDENMPKLREFYDWYLSELDNPDHLEPKRKEIDNQTARKLVAEYDEVADQLDFAQRRKKEIIEQLADMSKGRDALVCGRKLTKVVRAGSVAYAKVVKDHLKGVDLEPYRGKPSESWRLS